MRVVLVTGTGTGVGKTVTTAALAACAVRASQRVAVVKPVQTGVLPGEPGDLADVGRLTGLTDLHEYARYPEPLAPATAAGRLGEAGPDLAELAGRIAELADRDLVVLEGAGGALVRFNDRGEGLCELADAIATSVRSSDRAGARFEVVLVTGARLGSLHDAAATAGALAGRGYPPAHLVVGDWPEGPGLAECCNLLDLPSYAGAPLRGAIGHGAGGLASGEFARLALRSLAPALGGDFDAADFVRRHAAPEPTRASSR